MKPTDRADDWWDAVLSAIVAEGPVDFEPADDFPGDAPDSARDFVDDSARVCVDAFDEAANAEALVDPDAVSLLTGPANVALVRALRDVDPAQLSDLDRIRYLQATERVLAWLSALQSSALVAYAGPRSRLEEYEVESARVISIEDLDRSEIAAATRWSEQWTDKRITTARLLAGPLPRTGEALEAGTITVRHADAIAAAAERLTGFTEWSFDTADCHLDPTHRHHIVVRNFLERCAALEQAVLPRAARAGVASTGKAAERALLRLDADNVAKRRAAAKRDRDVVILPQPDGMALLLARMGIEQAQACLSVIDATARDSRLPLPADTPTDAAIGERRAVALAHMILSERTGSADDAEWVPAPVRTHVDVVIDLMSLVGLNDQAGTITGGGPGGPVPLDAEAIRALVAADDQATMRRLVTDPLTGHLLDRGRSTYAVPTSLRDFIVVRDGTCRFPGCNRRAGLAQIDHAVPWNRGGATDRANLGPLCIRHHQLKTHAGWTIIFSDAGGSAIWRSPAGLVYEYSPPPVCSRE